MWWQILLIILALLGIATGIFMWWDSANRKEVMELTFSDPEGWNVHRTFHWYCFSSEGCQGRVGC